MISRHQEPSHKPATPLPLFIRLYKTFPLRQPLPTPNQTAIPPGANERQGVNLTSSTTYQAVKMKTSRSNSRALSRDVLLVLPSRDTRPLSFRHQASGQRFRSSSPQPLHSRHHTKYNCPQPYLLISKTVAFAFRARLPHRPSMEV
jgi:hypothetical protein